MYHVEVSKVVGTSWLLVPSNTGGGMGNCRYLSHPYISGSQANLEGIHVIIRTMCVSFYPSFGIGVVKGYDIFGHNQHLLN